MDGDLVRCAELLEQAGNKGVTRFVVLAFDDFEFVFYWHRSSRVTSVENPYSGKSCINSDNISIINIDACVKNELVVC